MELKGLAHLNLTVSDFETSLPYYKKLFAFLGMREMINVDGYYYCVGKRVAMGIQKCTPDNAGTSFDQGRTGLHHFCLAMASRENVDELAEFVRSLGSKIVREPASNEDWFPGMYSCLFEDPDGIRIEANHITRQS